MYPSVCYHNSGTTMACDGSSCKPHMKSQMLKVLKTYFAFAFVNYKRVEYVFLESVWEKLDVYYGKLWKLLLWKLFGSCLSVLPCQWPPLWHWRSTLCVGEKQFASIVFPPQTCMKRRLYTYTLHFLWHWQSWHHQNHLEQNFYMFVTN